MSLTVYLDSGVCHRHPERESMLRLIDFLRDAFDADATEDIRLLGWPLIERSRSPGVGVDVEHDFLILSPKALIVGDFKNYGGSTLDGGKNTEWILTTSEGKRVPVRGGSQSNPYRQLEKNASDLTALLLDDMRHNTEEWGSLRVPSFPLMQNSIVRVVLFSGPIEHKTEQLQKTLADARKMHVLSMANGLNDLKVLISASDSIHPAFSGALPVSCVNHAVTAMGFSLANPFCSTAAPAPLQTFRTAETLVRIMANLTVIKWTEEMIEAEHGPLQGYGEWGHLYRKRAPRKLPTEKRNELGIRVREAKREYLAELSVLASTSTDILTRVLQDLTLDKPEPIVFDAEDIRCKGAALRAATEFAGADVCGSALADFPYSLVGHSVFSLHAGTLRCCAYEGGIWCKEDVVRYWHMVFGRLDDGSRRRLLDALNGLLFVMVTFWLNRIKHWCQRGRAVCMYVCANGNDPAWLAVRNAFVAERGDRSRQDLVLKLCETVNEVAGGTWHMFDQFSLLPSWCTATNAVPLTYLVARGHNDVYNWEKDEAFLNLPVHQTSYFRFENELHLIWLPIELLQTHSEAAKYVGDWRHLPDDLKTTIEDLTTRWQQIEKAQQERKVTPSALSPPVTNPPAHVAPTPVPASVTIVGYDDMKRYIEEHLIPFRSPDKAGKWGLLRPGGILLYGPPGCGKTHWAQWIAKSLNFIFQDVPRSSFGSIYVDGAMGQLAELLQSAVKAAPAVVFFHEFDSVARDRQIRGTDTEGAKVVNTLLQEIPKQIQAGNLLIAATNHVHQLDPAVIRPGRFDIKVPVFPPLPRERGELLTFYLTKDVPPDSPLRSMLEFNKALDPSYWEPFQKDMRLFSNSHLLKAADDLRKRIMVLYEGGAGSSEILLPPELVSEVLVGVKALIREGDVAVYRAFYDEVSMFFDRRSAERITTLRNELIDFIGNAGGASGGKPPIGFHP